MKPISPWIYVVIAIAAILIWRQDSSINTQTTGGGEGAPALPPGDACIGSNGTWTSGTTPWTGVCTCPPDYTHYTYAHFEGVNASFYGASELTFYRCAPSDSVQRSDCEAKGGTYTSPSNPASSPYGQCRCPYGAVDGGMLGGDCSITAWNIVQHNCELSGGTWAIPVTGYPTCSCQPPSSVNNMGDCLQIAYGGP